MVYVIYVIAFAVYFVADYIYISNQQRKHQMEWNRRKTNAIANGENPEDAYCEYLVYLMMFERHPLFGIGLPRF